MRLCPFARRLPRLVAPLLLGAAALFAATPPAVEPPRTWEFTGNLRTAVGYKDNLLLSAVRSEDRAFAQAEGELFLWRLPTERFEALAFAHGTLTRFLQSADYPHEWQAFAHAEARWFAPHDLQAALSAESYHLDQVFDLSATSAERLTARLAVDGVLAATALRWDFSPRTWLEFKPTVQRDRYDDGSDDHTQRIARGTVGQKFLADRIELALSAQSLRRTYDRRPRYTAAGRPLTGTELIFHQREAEARVTVAWDESKRWTTTTAFTGGTNRDNGSGYFDYRHRHVRQEITWTRAPWKLRLTARAARYDYDVQTQGIGIAPPKRLKEEFRIRPRLERTLTARATLYADYTWERSRSNDPLAHYRVKTAVTGVDWTF